MNDTGHGNFVPWWTIQYSTQDIKVQAIREMPKPAPVRQNGKTVKVLVWRCQRRAVEKERKVDRDRIFWTEGIAYSRAWKDVWIGQAQELQTNQWLVFKRKNGKRWSCRAHSILLYLQTMNIHHIIWLLLFFFLKRLWLNHIPQTFCVNRENS